MQLCLSRSVRAALKVIWKDLRLRRRPAFTIRWFRRRHLFWNTCSRIRRGAWCMYRHIRTTTWNYSCVLWANRRQRHRSGPFQLNSQENSSTSTTSQSLSNRLKSPKSLLKAISIQTACTARMLLSRRRFRAHSTCQSWRQRRLWSVRCLLIHVSVTTERQSERL